MNSQFYLDLAARGLHMPIGADLVLHEESDPEQARNAGATLGSVIERTARRWNTPLAIPLMDLRLEKFDLLAMIGIPLQEAETFHFASSMDGPALAALCGEQTALLCAGSQARNESLAYMRAVPELV